MPSYFPPIKNSEYIFYIGLINQTGDVDLVDTPTIAAGDFQVSTDGGALANLGTLPVVTPASTEMVKVTLSASEMNGDNVTFLGIDAAGDQWNDVLINIHPTVDTYQAKVVLIDAESSSTDRYVVTWFKNGEPITTGITSPTIQIIAVADGTDLVASVGLTEIASLQMYRHDEETGRVVDGAAYIAKVQATIDSATRTWHQPVGRDN